MKSKLLITTILALYSLSGYSQMDYQNIKNKNLSIGSYGRMGVDYSFENAGSIGRRLNLNNMGSIGGRLEEQDYLELVPALHFNPIDNDSTEINIQMRMAVFSSSLSLIGNSTSSSLGGLIFSFPEAYVEAKNISGTGLNIWVGARLYRGPDVHIADHRYFNDFSGQGFGIEYKNTRLSGIFVGSTDTSSTVPPYFYINIKTGTPSIALRQRTVWAAQHDIKPNPNCTFTLLAEYHRLGDADDNLPDSLQYLNYPSDYGFTFGVRHQRKLNKFGDDSYNVVALRYGSRIANGGDGGMSRSWLTFGAADLDNRNFAGAYSWAFVEEFLIYFTKKYSLNGYLIYTNSKGAADTNGKAETFYGREVWNKKEDIAIGFRGQHYLKPKFNLITELHYAYRKDGTEEPASSVKFSIAPTLVPTGEANYWARPHIRFIASVARYNDYAMKNLYSPYLQFVGEKRWGYFLGLKAEWWIF